MRILFVAMADSVHTARWISQVADQDWDLYLFPVYRATPHPQLRNLTLFGFDPIRPAVLDKSVKYKGWTSYYIYRQYIENRIKHHLTLHQETALAKVIQSVKPDLIHALEFQHSAYMTMGAKKMLSTPFPKWIATNWGSDIYLFSKLAAHRPKIQEVLANCDYYSAECQRDVQMARDMGFRGEVLPVMPNTGGFDLDHISSLSQNGPPSTRKLILVKGYQHFAGRALFALRSLALCADLLKDYRIAVYSASTDVEIAAEIISQDSDIHIEIVPFCTHDELLQLHGKSRIYLGLSISDAISTSLLEAMVMGAFPIQSDTSCANEWIKDGISGLIVPPEDPHTVALALRRALTDDELVDHAAKHNAEVCAERLDYCKLQAQAIDIYEHVFVDKQKHRYAG